MRSKLIKKITILSVLMALSVVLKKFSIDTGHYRISLFDTPLVLAGIIGGPLWGMVVAFGSDLLYNLLSGYSYSFIMMISALLWGAVGGIFHYVKPKYLLLLLLVLITGVLTTTTNSLQLSLWYGTESMLGGLPLRVANMLIKWPITTTLVYILYNRVIGILINDPRIKKPERVNKEERKETIIDRDHKRRLVK